ncbi:endo-1,4-beta-xylanase [Ruminococcus callidus]|uniref:endo-1,4-beta-xylanase n=1 Tax=Ruminococcus callidus TaxID=40519 RepID=UPI001D010F5D|nr:endo-1,4-beta-xylanase [Ruminococcus callidus]MCB5775630.1 endo-1,4-beta-xylanase [Ruminococcus callidus]MCC2759256.1 endo-1,4-beta-xylanase [Ruminococcus callidus]
MKFGRILAAVTTGVLAVSSMSFTGLVGYAAPEELMNDTFESGFGAWKGVGSSLSLSTEQAHSGGTSLYCYDRTANWGAPRCSLTGIVAAGQSYEISASAMYEGSGQQNMAIKMIYTDTSGTDHYEQVAATQATAGQWVEMKGNYTIPSGATGMILYVEMPNANTDQTYYIDDVVIKGEKTEIKLDDKFESDFEDGTQSWNGRGSATAERSTTYAHSGNASLYVSGRTQLWNGSTRSVADIMEAGGYYKVGTYVLYDGDQYSDTQKFSINLQYDYNGKENYYTIATETAKKGEWQYVGSEFTAPEGATNFYIYVQTGYTSAPKEQDLMNFYMDDAVGERLPDPTIQDDIASLKDAYSDYFKIGCACTGSEFAQGATKDLIKKHYNSLTLGNELKPDSVLDQALSQKYVAETGDDTMPQISLNEADEMLKFAGENKIPVRGHVLVWHSQTPDWFFKENFDPNGAWVSKDKMTKRLENYIKTVMETLKKDYPDVEFYAWDVVNEAASDAGTIRDAGSNNEVDGQSAWVKVYGDQSYIPLAFEFAKKYAPAGCKLFYNDYNEYSPNKQAYIISDILKPLVEKNLIDGVGMQSHISMSYPTIDLYKSAMQQYADLGLEVQVTELDVSEKSNEHANQLALAQRYQDVFKMYKEMKDSGVNLSAVVLWGITDSTSWIGGYPLLFDKDYQAKPSYYAVIDTDSEVEKLQTMTAYRYDGTDADLERALEIGTAQYLNNGTTYFKAAWSDKGMVVRVYNPVWSDDITIEGCDAYVSQVFLYGSTTNQKGDFIWNGFVEENDAYVDAYAMISGQELTGKVGDTVYLDVYSDAAGWNDTEYAQNNYLARTAGKTMDTLPTCGIVTLAEQPKYAEATKTETPITIDGDIDAAWADANTIDVNTYSMGNGATAVSKMLWDENYFYVLTEVTDPVLSVASANAYEQDTVEVFFDENNHKTSSYESDDIQCRINYENDKTVTDGRSTDAFLSGTKKTDKGYIVEVAIPYTIGSFHANQIVGFDVQVNDDGTGDGKRTSMANWNDLTGQGYINTSGFGVLKLVGDGTEVTGTTTTTGTGTTTETTTTTSVTTATTEATGETTTADDSVLYGDVNLDGDVDLSDAVLLNKAVAGVVELNDQQKKNADCAAGGGIGGDDSMSLLRFLVHLINQLPE